MERTGVRIRADSRDRLDLAPSLVRPDGRLPLALVATARHVADRLDQAHRTGAGDAAGPTVLGGELNAYGLIDQVLHYILHLYLEEVDPAALETAAASAEVAIGSAAVGTLDAYQAELPLREGRSLVDPLARTAVLEDLLLTRVANENPAAAGFRELWDDRPLSRSSGYDTLLEAIETHLATLPGFGPDGETLLELLRAPARAADTLAGQLAFIRDRWGDLLGDLLERLLVAMAVLEEDERGLWMRTHPWSGGPGTGAGSVGDLSALEGEPERFSMDKEWMPRLVLMAKSTYVWLDQLAKAYGRDIRTLDGVPDEELDRLRRWGVTGLWLIGLWERSRASERIKRMRGNPEAVASAYSLDDYRIADDLGGEAAWANLRDRAWARGIRLSSDMVPNHMGIDSRWVIEHPERFLSLREPPYPAYSFTGADLSDDPRVAIRIEDHYWDATDAAVVFQRVDTQSGDVRYIYHGNDGTSMPWNDTAQLDYLDPAVREVVIQTILDVARRFPIIRFDAAMTLAKRHIQRLWYPVPGSGGSIASRAEHAVPQAAFDAAMPHEFWRDVVDRVAAEAPDTLLLAEAFWLMEGYFVRTLGMHRVYNSAFMHMLRDEDNAGYRSVIKNTLEFDPEILKRYVNFMNNPDERTAVEQFGKGDKYFGVATLMATLPGLPMLGHGQVEGYAEKYGMEYRRAYHDESPDPWLVERHERELFPILHERARFAEARDFLLFDVFRDDGSVDEDVYAYSNGTGGWRSLVVYHNRYADTAGTIRMSAASSEPDGVGGRRLVRRSLAEGWGLSMDPGALVRYRDRVTGLEYLHRTATLRDGGLRLELRAYERRVLMDVADIQDGVSGLWGRLADRLAGRGVPSLEAAFRDLELEPVHGPVRELVGADLLGAVSRAIAGKEALPEWALPEVDRRMRSTLAAVRGATGASRGEADERIADRTRARLERLVSLADAWRVDDGTGDGTTAASKDGRLERMPADEPADEPAVEPAVDPLTPAGAIAAQLADPGDAAALVVWALLEPIGRAGEAADTRATTRAWLDELRLIPLIADALRAIGLEESAAWRAAERVRLLVATPRTLPADGGKDLTLTALLERAIGDDDVRRSIRVNRWEGAEWFEREAFEALLATGVALDAIEAPWLVAAGKVSGKGPRPADTAQRTDTSRPAEDPAVAAAMERAVVVARALRAAGAAAGYRVDRMLAGVATLDDADPT